MPEPALADLQALFWRALHGAVDPALEAAVVSTPGLPGSERLGIYASMYFWRLRDVLAEDFEKTAAALGNERFTEAVRAYLASNASEHPSVRHFGRNFASFLAASPPGDAPPWLADLAMLEWSRVEVFDAPDVAPLGLEDLRAVEAEDWPELHFQPIAALEVVESAWPLDVVWRDGGDPPPAGTALRVWRQDGSVYHCAMDATEQKALAILRSGATFGAICEAFADLEPENAAAEAGSLLARWIEDGLLARST